MNARPSIDDLFERRITYPDFEPQSRLARLVGLDEYKTRLTKILGLLVNPAGLEAWAKRYHPNAGVLLDIVLRRPPLVVLAGDVGSGKTELAETIGDAVARQEEIEAPIDGPFGGVLDRDDPEVGGLRFGAAEHFIDRRARQRVHADQFRKHRFHHIERPGIASGQRRRWN